MPIGFAGGIEDPVTGLVRFGLRDYDPVLGRFTTRDPLLFGGGQRNLYAYAGSDPVRLVDPSGLVSTEVGICRGICVGVKFGLTSKGLSACVSGGFGNSNALEFAPDGGLEETRTGFKATGGVELGDPSRSRSTRRRRSRSARRSSLRSCASTEVLRRRRHQVLAAGSVDLQRGGHRHEAPRGGALQGSARRLHVPGPAVLTLPEGDDLGIPRFQSPCARKRITLERVQEVSRWRP